VTIVRACAITFALGCVGCCADPADPEGYAAYLDLVARGETHQRAAEMAKASDCGLVLAGVLHVVLATCPPELLAPYRTGYALVDLHAAAARAGAVRPRGEPPTPGDIVHLGAANGACEHVYIVVETLGGGRLRSVDGGQRTLGGLDGSVAGLETIRLVEREIRSGIDYRDGGAARPVLEVYDLDALGAYYGVADLRADPTPA